MRGYYLLDEYSKAGRWRRATRSCADFGLTVSAASGLHASKIFDHQGEIESDIVYGKEGNLTDTGNYANLPLEIQVTRPKEKYSMKLTYQTPEAVCRSGKPIPTPHLCLKIPGI